MIPINYACNRSRLVRQVRLRMSKLALFVPHVILASSLLLFCESAFCQEVENRDEIAPIAAGDLEPPEKQTQEKSDLAESTLVSELNEAEVIDLLTKDPQGQRNLAMLELWRRRGSLGEMIQRLSIHEDAEVRARARWILKQWAKGALPETPEDMERLLDRVPGESSLKALLKIGDFTSIIVALGESADTLEGRSSRDDLATEIYRNFPTYAFVAYEQDAISELIEILDLVANTVELAICRYELKVQFGQQVSLEELLPRSAENWTPLLKLQAECVLLYLNGDVTKAVDLARLSVDSELLNRVLMVSDDWETLAKETAIKARQSSLGMLEKSKLWVLVLAASQRSLTGRESPRSQWDLRQEAIGSLQMEVNDGSIEGKLAAAMRWKALASHGEIDKALDIASELNLSDAAGLCKDASRIDKAFEILGTPLEEVDLNLDIWISEAIEQQRSSNLRDLSPKIREILTLMQCFISIGRDELAYEIADRLSSCGEKVGPIDIREFVISTLAMTKRIDWMVKLAVPQGGAAITQQTYNTISRSLTDCDLSTLKTTVDALADARPSETLQDIFDDAVNLFLDAQQPLDDIEPRVNRSLQSLFTFLFSDTPARKLADRVGGDRSTQVNLNFVKLFKRHGQMRYAETCLLELIRQGDLDAKLVMAEYQLQAGRSAAAERLFNELATISFNQDAKQQRFAPPSNSHISVRARIGLWRLAKLAQDSATADFLLKGIRYSLCTPNLVEKNNLAEYLSEQSEDTLALEVFEDLLPVVAMGQRGQLTLYDVARRYSPLIKDRQPKIASRWFDLALNQTLWNVDFRSGAYVTLPMFVHRWGLESEIRSGDVEAVRLRLDQMLALDSMDVDFAERLLPKMREKGMLEDADRVLNHIIDQGLEHASQFPFDAMTCNNVAWIAAVNQSRLSDALLLSKIAVRAEPESAIYRDTLAEVLFQLKRPEEALQIEKGCLLDDPTQWHLHEQREKYQASISEK